MRIACLHTAASNVEVFEGARAAMGAPGLALTHHVRPDLLEACQEAGGLTAAVSEKTAALLRALGEAADGVLLTCSTLGPAAERPGRVTEAPVMRADAALAEEARRAGGPILVLCAAPTTLEPTRALFERAVEGEAARVEIALIDGAWALFRSQDLRAYAEAIAAAVRQGRDDGFDIIALAQASMAPSADLFTKEERPLTVPASGLGAMVRALGGTPLGPRT